MMKTRGFTLIEVLVALLIMAVLATLAWRGIDSLARSREIAQDRVERTLRLNTVLAQWEQDLLALHDKVPVPTLQFDGANARLVRDAEGGVQMVVWSLRDDVWTRWAGPVVTRTGDLQENWLRSQQLLGSEPGHVRALAGVSDWQMYFFQGNAWANAQSSGDVAPPFEPAASAPAAPPRVQLPSGVRIVLTLPEGPLTRDVRLAPQFP
jgi:general secretion pathway protein J